MLKNNAIKIGLEFFIDIETTRLLTINPSSLHRMSNTNQSLLNIIFERIAPLKQAMFIANKSPINTSKNSHQVDAKSILTEGGLASLTHPKASIVERIVSTVFAGVILAIHSGCSLLKKLTHPIRQTFKVTKNLTNTPLGVVVKSKSQYETTPLLEAAQAGAHGKGIVVISPEIGTRVKRGQLPSRLPHRALCICST